MVRRSESAARRIVRNAADSHSIDLSKFFLSTRALDDCGIQMRQGRATAQVTRDALHTHQQLLRLVIPAPRSLWPQQMNSAKPLVNPVLHDEILGAGQNLSAIVGKLKR